MRIRLLKVGTLEIPLDDLHADTLELGVLRIVNGDRASEFVLSASPGVIFRYVYELSNSSFPSNRFVVPGGPAADAKGTAVLSVAGDGTGRLTSSVSGLCKMSTEAGAYETWLIHDLRVPHEIDECDLAALPRGTDGHGNAPGVTFTIDGNAPSVTDGPSSHPNTVWIPVSTGTFNTGDDGCQKTLWDFSPLTNWTFSLLELLGLRTGQKDSEEEGPRDPDNPRERRVSLIPSGIARAILNDLFMRPVTVHPELSIVHHFARRLLAVHCEHMEPFDREGYGRVSPQDVWGRPECYIGPSEFGRMAVTRELREGLTGPRSVPSQKAFVLATGFRDDWRESR